MNLGHGDIEAENFILSLRYHSCDDGSNLDQRTFLSNWETRCNGKADANNLRQKQANIDKFVEIDPVEKCFDLGDTTAFGSDEGEGGEYDSPMARG